MGSLIARVVTFPDTSQDWLAYLERRTRHTIGSRYARAALVVVGIRRGTTLDVDEVLKGQTPARGRIDIDVPEPVDFDGSAALHVVPYDGDRTLAFLSAGGDGSWRAVHEPGAFVVEWTGGGLERDLNVARWFMGLPEQSGPRVAALLDGARDPEHSTAASALRALGAEQHTDASGEVVALAQADVTTPATWAVAAVTLWLLGAGDQAQDAMTAAIEHTGRAQFLSLWGVQETDGDPRTLYGPDPEGEAYP